MGVIKTALEIAMEKTEKVKSDRAGIDQFEAKQRGKKLANAYLASEADLEAEIKKTEPSRLESLKQGIFDVLLSQIALPSGKNEEEQKRFEAIGKGLAAVIKKSEFIEMYKELSMHFSQYLQEAAHYDQVIRQQYAPKLRQKEEELSRRMGREVRIDPFQDPEFVAFYNQHINALKGNYEAIIEQAKEQTRLFFESA